MKTSLFLVMALFVTACAAKHEKLQAYVGEDIQKVVAVYGYPTVAFDMQAGRRDFQWVVISTREPSYEISPGALTDPAKQFDPDIKPESITPEFAGKVVTSKCLLTMLTRWDEDAQSWIVTDYQQPAGGC